MAEAILTVDDLDAAVAHGESSCATLRFDRNVFLHQLVVGYVLWIIESASSISLLLKHDRISDSKTLLRAMLECYLDLELLQKDQKHLWNIQYDFCVRMLRQLEQAELGNPFAESILLNIDVTTERATWQKKKEIVFGHGGRSIQIEQKFVSLGLKNHYEMLYRSLSQSAHSTFAGIIARSFVIDKDKGDFEAVLYRAADPESISVVIDTTISLIDRCSILSKDMLPLTHPSSTPQ